MCEKGERGRISEAPMQMCSKLTKNIGPLIRHSCCVRLGFCATKSIMNAVLCVVKEQGRVTGSRTLGKQLEAYLCFTVAQLLFFIIKFPAACTPHNFSPGSGRMSLSELRNYRRWLQSLFQPGLQ